MIDNPHLQLDPYEEWETVLNLIRKHGFYKSTDAFNEMGLLTSNVVKQIGWGNLCMSENITWLKKDFIEIFKNKQQSIETVEMLNEPVMTISEIIAKASEYWNEKPKLLNEVENESM